MAGNPSVDGLFSCRISGGGRLGWGPSRLGVVQVDHLGTFSRLSLYAGNFVTAMR